MKKHLPVTDCPRDELGRSTCAEWIRGMLREYAELLYPGVGCEAVISTAPPLVKSVYGVQAHTCPHGVTYYCEPTGEQLMRWAEQEVE